jgi:hypothetical protein
MCVAIAVAIVMVLKYFGPRVMTVFTLDFSIIIDGQLTGRKYLA